VLATSTESGWTYDLRIKAVLDDGSRVQDVLITGDTERLGKPHIRGGKADGMEALDHEVVRS